MKFLLQTLSTIVICFALQFLFPWWTMALGAFLSGWYFRNKGFVSFLAGFAGVALLWASMALIISFSTAAVLTTRIKLLLPLHPVIFTALVGGLVGGFASLSGALLKKP